MKRLALPTLTMLSIACSLTFLLTTNAASKQPSAITTGITDTTDAIYTQHDDRKLHLISSHHGVVVNMAKPSGLIGLITGDVIQSVDDIDVNNVRALTDAIRLEKRNSAIFTVQRSGQVRQVRISAQDLAKWIPPEPSPKGR
jgi:S1-C subfamily serine protease